MLFRSINTDRAAVVSSSFVFVPPLSTRRTKRPFVFFVVFFFFSFFWGAGTPYIYPATTREMPINILKPYTLGVLGQGIAEGGTGGGGAGGRGCWLLFCCCRCCCCFSGHLGGSADLFFPTFSLRGVVVKWGLLEETPSVLCASVTDNNGCYSCTCKSLGKLFFFCGGVVSAGQAISLLCQALNE